MSGFSFFFGGSDRDGRSERSGSDAGGEEAGGDADAGPSGVAGVSDRAGGTAVTGGTAPTDCLGPFAQATIPTVTARPQTRTAATITKGPVRAGGFPTGDSSFGADRLDRVACFRPFGIWLTGTKTRRRA